jgi:hypothetical protein
MLILLNQRLNASKSAWTITPALVLSTLVVTGGIALIFYWQPSLGSPLLF